MYDKFTAFVKSIYKTDKFIPLHAPFFNGNEKKYLNECIDSTFVSSVGEFVDRFELMTADYTKSKKAVVCVNGTNALHMALVLLGVGPEDEIITQSLTFIATANAISYTGAKPIFLDVDIDTMGLSPNAVELWLKDNTIVKNSKCYNKKTGRCIKACIPMHTFGFPMKIDELVNICSQYFIDVIEDAAESLGSFYKNQHTGTFGKIGVMSYNGNKTITTGGGGMLLFQDEELAKKAKHLTTQSKIPHKWEFIHDNIGYNYRMPNINAALGCAQMEELEHILRNKRDTALLYKNFFESNLDMIFFVEPKNSKSNYWLNTIILKDKDKRNTFLQYTNDNGVMTRPIWGLMNKLEMFKMYETDELTNTIWFEERVVNIPSSVRR